jgi:hypothetical protein
LGNKKPRGYDRLALQQVQLTITHKVKMMMPQTVLPFKLEITNEKITPHAGLIVFGEFLKSLTVPHLLDRHLPGPGSGRATSRAASSSRGC